MNEKMPFEISYRENSGVRILDIGGYLDAYTASDLEQSLADVIEKGEHKIIVNFAKLEYISSAGLGVFMAFIEDLRAKKGDIKLAAMNQKVYSVFDLLGFPMLFDIEGDETKLIDKFSKADDTINE